MNTKIRKERRLTNNDPKDEISSLSEFSFWLRSPESTFTASVLTCPIKYGGKTNGVEKKMRRNKGNVNMQPYWNRYFQFSRQFSHGAEGLHIPASPLNAKLPW